jgi:hypothetical protein
MMMYEFIKEVLGEIAYWLDPAQRRYFPQDILIILDLDVQCQELSEI